MTSHHILTHSQRHADAKFLKSSPSQYHAPAAQFYAGLHSRAQKGREARKLHWRTWLLTPIERS